MGMSNRGVGLRFPPRESDCTGRRPSWFAFNVNVCDDDDPDPVPYTSRHFSIGAAKPIPWWPPAR